MEMRASAERDRKKLAEDERKAESSSSAADEKLETNQEPSSSNEKVKGLDKDDVSDGNRIPDPEEKTVEDSIRNIVRAMIELRALVGWDSAKEIAYAAMEARALAERERKKLAEDERKAESSSSAADEKLETNQEPSSSNEKVKGLDKEANMNKKAIEENKEMSAIADDDDEKTPKCMDVFVKFLRRLPFTIRSCFGRRK
ncbi:uncharacterized protein LOC111624114 [Centruroides sculpturatus]|uniref:uncharacterized protein LOC111624114 n=1 Tax=Centruroides sculpturatus TaxID=218467 RepID=UPI000C6E76DF|nr:uncharacterized protein LOC111624114 [Centruroides sculpturatus]